MYILSWVVLGAFAGWITGRVSRGNRPASWANAAMGIAGALAGGFVMSYGGIPGRFEVVSATLSAIFGAVVLTAIAAYVIGRKRYA